MSGLCSSSVLTLGMRSRSLSSFRKRCWLLRAKSTAEEAIDESFLWSRKIRKDADRDSEETNQYSATGDSMRSRCFGLLAFLNSKCRFFRDQLSGTVRVKKRQGRAPVGCLRLQRT